MNISFHSIMDSSSADTNQESFLSSQQKQVVAIALAAYLVLATCFLIQRRCFRATVGNPHGAPVKARIPHIAPIGHAAPAAEYRKTGS